MWRFELLWIGRAIVLLQLIPGILGWGKEGHYAICKIAEGYLSEDASAAVKALLPDSAEGDLASVCSWADEIRFRYHWSGPLHYVDTPDFRCNYNYGHKKNPVSLLVQFEVALGEVYELTEANYMDKPPQGKHYTKGLGKMIPQPSEYVKWRDEVVVLCGKPFASNISGSLQYNEYIVYDTAQGYLFEDALAAVKALLPDSAEGDCHDTGGRKNACVSGAMYNYTMQLMSAYNGSNSEMKYNLTEALMFLSHFVGDVHQPLHVGFTGDEGGNTITIRWYKRKTNLHHVWDTMIIESALKTFYDKDLSIMIQAIQRNITDRWSDDILTWQSCALDQTVCPDPYATESINLACKFAYRNATPGSTLGDDYFLSRLPVVEKRLAQSGMRLAATLNRIFASRPPVFQE